MPPFKHAPLPSPERDIRLLTVTIGDDPEDIRCSLSAASLNDNPTYIAISYEWGESEPSVDVRVEGKRFCARHNLFLLLQYLATYADPTHTSRPYRFWIDAICINQQNDAEKSLQVQNMGRIYRQAEYVLAWLGWPSDWSPKEAFKFIRDHAAASSTPGGPVSLPGSHTSEQNRLLGFYEDMLRNNLHDVKPVRKLCECRYWSRRWIVQELILASTVKIICGEESLSLETLSRFFRALDHTINTLFPKGFFQTLDHDLPQCLPSPVGNLWRAVKDSIPHHICRDRDQQRHNGKLLTTMAELLISYRSTSCELLLDRIFSLVALATGKPLETNYCMSNLEIYARVHQFYDRLSYAAYEDTCVVADALDLCWNRLDSPGQGAMFLEYSAQLQSCVLRTTPAKVIPRILASTKPSAESLTIGESATAAFYRDNLVESFPANLGMVAHLSYHAHWWPISHVTSQEITMQQKLLDLKKRWHSGLLASRRRVPDTGCVYVDRIVCSDGRSRLATGGAEVGDIICRYGQEKYFLVRATPGRLNYLQIVGLVGDITAPCAGREELEIEGEPGVNALLWQKHSLTPSDCHDAVMHALGQGPEEFRVLTNSPALTMYLNPAELIQAINLWP